jgi:hypothetical protein
MTVPTSNKSISIHPKTFTDDLPDLSKMSLEEVVARFKDVEKKRNIHSEPDSEQEVPWTIHSAPTELMSSLKIVSAHMGIPRNVLTKCMSRQVIDWYNNSLGINDIITTYGAVYTDIKLKSYRSLRIQAENPAKFGYVFPKEDAHTSISTIRWVAAKLGELRDAIGVSSIDLLLVGFCWGLTTLDNLDWDKRNIEQFFVPETENMSCLIVDRGIDIAGLVKKYEYRVTKDIKVGK